MKLQNKRRRLTKQLMTHFNYNIFVVVFYAVNARAMAFNVKRGRFS